MSRLFPLLLLLGLWAGVGAAHAQSSGTYTFTGTVLDGTTDEPLPGANVRIRGTSFGTATQPDGTFSFQARLTGGTVVVEASFVGFRPTSTEVDLDAPGTVNVGPLRLEPGVIGAEEVVVTGTGGPTERKRLGTSISTVDAQDLESVPATSIDQALQGKVAGANIQQNSGDPAGGLSIRLRGTSTVLGDANPLIIVDGVIISNDSPELIDVGGTSQNRLVDLNPNDIARIEVVKGAAAAALYGSRANDGVVQIFTKRGQSGAPQVTFSTRVKRDAVRKTLDVNQAQNDQGQFLDNSGNPLPEGERRWDWQDFIFDPAYGTEQYLSVSGGSEATRYVFSGAHYASQGVVEGSQFRRVNGRARIDQTLTDWLTLSAGAKFAWNRSAEVPNGGVSASYGALTGFLFGPNTFDPRPTEFGEYPNGSVLANPVEVIDRFDLGQETRRFVGNVQVDANPLPGLLINYVIGLDTYNQVGLSFIPRGTTAPGQGDGFSRRSTQGVLQVNQDASVRYETDVTDRVTSTSLVGASMQYSNTERFSAESQDLAPLVEVVQSGTRSRVFGETRTPFSLYGVFGQQTVGLADRLFLTGAVRFDASSSFGEGERWQAYPKVSGSYVLSEQSFWQGSVLQTAIPTFKVRASLGVSGGLSSINSFERFTPYTPQPYLGNPGLVPPTQLGAVDVKPERQREIEVGADLSFFRDRAALEFTYYTQETTDLLLSRNVAPTSGFSTRLDNVGSLTNRGIEVLVRGVPIANEIVRWTTSVTYARNRNEVDNLGQDLIQFPRSFGGISAAQNGEPLGFFYGSTLARNDAGQVVDQAGNPMTRDDDGFLRPTSGDSDGAGYGLPASSGEAGIIGDPNPDWTGSWINTVTLWKNLNVRLQLDAVQGQDVFNFTRRLGAFGPFGTLEDYERELEGDLPSGYNSAVFGIFENWVEDGSFVKLREVSISYTLRPDGLPVRSIRFNAAGRNLVSFDDYSGYDPEVNVTGQSTTVRGFDFASVPIPRSYSLGITVGM